VYQVAPLASMANPLRTLSAAISAAIHRFMEASSAECGCSIVAMALDRYSDFDTKEAAVVAIWRRTVGRELPLQHGQEEICWLAATKRVTVRFSAGRPS
jgi:hypothetical protein